MCHLLLFFHVQAANQPIITDVALCHKKFGDSWVRPFGNIRKEKKF